MKYYLLKTEPQTFSWQTLKEMPAQTTIWEGVRNYQARNFLRAMKKGDLCLFYHSNVTPNIIPGIVKVVREAYPDPFAFDSRSKYYDGKSDPQNPRWFAVDVQLAEEFVTPVTREQLKEIPELAGMELLKTGSRLSVQPVSEREFSIIRKLGAKAGG